MPSPNGATLSLATGKAITLCGCLRNAEAVAFYAIKKGTKIAVIAAGEQLPDGSLRPAFEDIAGAGAIISFLKGSFSPESRGALSVFKATNHIALALKQSSSGKELTERALKQI